ncbi:hypothetical protein ACM2W4_15470 [Enterococcus casseliflavus]|uniref:hypothetical protein n=1 Tax=Enterococcus casseliflavus TaxID=37734 RepID=UPI0037C29A2C|nr:hypothetical protein [Enterococcus faecium]
MRKVIHSTIMEHIGKTIEDRGITDLHKGLYRIAPIVGNMDHFDLMIIDKLINKFDFNRLTSRRRISFTQFVLEFFPSPGYLEYAFVLKRLLNISTLFVTNVVEVEGAHQAYTDDNFEKYIANGPELKHNVIMSNHLIDGFEFELIENDITLTLGINMDHIDFLQNLSKKNYM